MKFKTGRNSEIKRLLVIVAMSIEEQAIDKTLGNYQEIEISESLRIKAKIFKKNGKELILVTSGIGIVNAGVTTALVADKFQIDCVLLFGVAGALQPGLDIGQLIVATQVIQHDSIYAGDAGDQLMAPGAPYVSIAPRERENPIYETDSEFRSWLKIALLAYPKVCVSEGTLLSGSQFVGSAVRKREIGSLRSDALAVEMEAAGIAVVTRRLGIPFVVLKTIADRLNPDDSISSDYNRFIKAAAENAGDVMDVVWRGWTIEE